MANGWWNLDGAITSCVAAYQPVGAASYAASKSNLFNPGTLDAVDGAAYPTWDATNGWMFAGASSQYLNTGIVPADQYSIIIRYSNITSAAGAFAITSSLNASPTCYFEINPRHTGDKPRFLYGDKTVTAADTYSAAGVIAMTNAHGYLAGSPIADIPAYAWNGSPFDVAIGARHGNLYANYITAYIQAIVIYNATLTDTQIGLLTTAMNALPVADTDDLTAADFTLSPVNFDAPTLTNVTGTEDLTAADFTLAAPTFDAPTLEITWNTPACRTYAIPAEARVLTIPSEDRGLKITCSNESKYEITRLTYNGLTGADFTLAQPTFDAPTLISGRYVPGVWSWFTKPTFVYYDNNKYFVVIDTQSADLNIHKYDTTTNILTSQTLNASFGTDDHNLAAILFRDSDKKLMIFGATHNGSTIYEWISTNAEDVSAFGSAIDLDASLGGSQYSYPCPIQLTGETNDPIYLFYRNYDGAWDGQYYSTSTDGGATWAAGTKFFQHIEGATEDRLYFQYARNGTDRIDFACTQGHPSTVAGSSIYHFYYTGGKYYKSDGTEITDALPLEPADVTQVYDGSSVESWVWDIAIDSGGNPIIVYATFPTPASDHRYNFARWTGSAWDIHEICTAGAPLYTAETNYSGGVTIDKGNPNIVWCSRNVTGQWEIYKYVTADGGATWAETKIITGSTGVNIRPTCADGATELYPLWCEGRYTTYKDTDCQVKFTN